MLDVNAILWHTLRTMTEIKYSRKGTAWAVEIQGDSHEEIQQRLEKLLKVDGLSAFTAKSLMKARLCLGRVIRIAESSSILQDKR